MPARRSSLAYLRPYRRTLVGGVAMLLATNVFFLGVPEFLKRSIDALKAGNFDVIPPAETE